MRNLNRWAMPGLLGLMLGLSAAPAEAAVFLSGMRVVVPEGQTLEDDVYVAGGEVQIDGRITGDLYLAGGVLTVRGSVAGDVVAAGGDLTISGPVGGAARLASAQLRLAGPVDGDVLAAAGDLRTLPGLKVGGESVLQAAEMTLEGALGARLTASAGNLLMRGTALGPTHLEAPRLRLGPEARIHGPLLLRTAMLDAIAPGVVIHGPVDKRLLETAGFAQAFWPWLLRLVMGLVLGLTLLWLMPELANRVGKAAVSALWLRFLAGLGLMIAAPMVAIMLMLTVVGLPVGLLALGAYGVCLYLAQIVVAWAAGSWALQRVWAVDSNLQRAAALALGMVAVWALKAVPVAGAYLTMAFVVWGLGAIAAVFYHAFRQHHPA